MLNESLEGVAPPKYIDYLVTTIFPKYNIDSMSTTSCKFRESLHSTPC